MVSKLEERGEVARAVVDIEGHCDAEEDELCRADEKNVASVAVADVVGDLLVRVHRLHRRHTVQNLQRYVVGKEAEHYACKEDSKLNAETILAGLSEPHRDERWK